MSKINPLIMAAAFFCAAGWVCIGPANGEDAETFVEGAATPVPPRPAQPELPEDVDTAQVSDIDTVSLNVQNTELVNVLQLLSIQGQRNIVPSPNVAGSVTANLYEVTFHEALDAILQQNGAGYLEKGRFIYVYTMDELKQIQEASRKVVHRVVRLNYITAKDASTFITPLLSSAGSVAISGEVAVGFQPTISDGGANSSAHAETMLIRDYPENIEEMAAVIKQLDIKPLQVLVEATVLKAKLTENLAFGVDIAVIGDVSGFDPIDALTGNLNSIVGAGGDKNFAGKSLVGGASGADTALEGAKIGFAAGGVAAFVEALDKVTDTVILANPKIMALNRQRAEILVGEKVAYLSTTTNQTSTTQTVEFLDTGTKLTLRPFVSQEDGKYVVRLELAPSISSAELRTAGTVTLPDEATQELTTNVMVPEGQTVVLGGLFEEETTISRRQVPGLSNLPIIGEAFKGQDDTIVRTETIFLVTPHVVKDRALSVAGAAINEGVEMTRIGAREKLLPWSRSKLSAAHVRDALRAMEKGDKSRASWEAGLALDLDPRMTEARRLKEKLAGHRLYWPNNSLMDSMVDNMVRKQTGKDRKSSVPVKPDSAPSREAMDGIGSKAADESVADETTNENQATGETIETDTEVPAEAVDAAETQPETDNSEHPKTGGAEQVPPVDPEVIESVDEAELSIGVGESSSPVKLKPVDGEPTDGSGATDGAETKSSEPDAAEGSLTGVNSEQRAAEENLVREFLGK